MQRPAVFALLYSLFASSFPQTVALHLLHEHQILGVETCRRAYNLGQLLVCDMNFQRFDSHGATSAGDSADVVRLKVVAWPQDAEIASATAATIMTRDERRDPRSRICSASFSRVARVTLCNAGMGDRADVMRLTRWRVSAFSGSR